VRACVRACVRALNVCALCALSHTRMDDAACALHVLHAPRIFGSHDESIGDIKLMAFSISSQKLN